MLTLASAIACDSMESPFINACDYDLAGATLKQIYGPLAPPKPADDGLHAFAQDRVRRCRARPTAWPHRGFVYIPKACAEGARCRLHVAFHGCQQNEAMIGDAFVRHAGYNGWAEANDIVVLYPQTAVLASAPRLGVPLPWPNPQGCWDWWGYTGADYARKAGARSTPSRR